MRTSEELEKPPPHSNVVNLFGTTGNSTEFELATTGDEDQDVGFPLSFDRDGPVEVGGDRTFLVPGDMVAIRYIRLSNCLASQG